MPHLAETGGRAEPADQPWTTRRLLAWMTERFKAAEVDQPRIVAEMLLAHVLGCDRMRLYMEADRAAAPGELERLRALVVRAGRHEPVQYLTGRATFLAQEFLVDDSTLIPQPATETLVEAVVGVLEAGRADDADPGDIVPGDIVPSNIVPGVGDQSDHADHGDHREDVDAGPAPRRRHDAPLRIADVGTGSGCIAVALAQRLSGATFVATDIVSAALDLARRNAERFDVSDRIEFVAGDGLEPLRATGGPFDAICSNPPYIPDAEWNGGQVQAAVREHVPESATRGGTDGLDVIRPLIAGAAALLKPGGLLAVEIAHVHRDRVLALAADAGLERAEVLKDGDGLWRVLVARRA